MSKGLKLLSVWPLNQLFDPDFVGDPVFVEDFEFNQQCQSKMLEACEILKTDEQFDKISSIADLIKKDLNEKGVSVKFDNRDTHRPGAKFAQHELQGVPLRIAIGPKDLENGTVEVARRDTKTKDITALDNITQTVEDLLKEIQNNLYKSALDYRDSHITLVDDFDAFKAELESKGGFISAHWDGTIETENKIKEITKATIRCIPSDVNEEEGKCVFTGNPSKRRVLFAKAY